MNNPTTQKPAGSRYSTMSMVQVAIFGAIICIMAFTPFLGYIPLGFTRATIIHIPVIIASLLMGPKKGGVLGFLFGLTSFINNTINPTATSFVFTPFYSLGDVSGGIGSVIICFVPRILVGIIPYFVYKLILKLSSEETRNRGVSNAGLVLAGISGALVNTLLVMNLIFILLEMTMMSRLEIHEKRYELWAQVPITLCFGSFIDVSMHVLWWLEPTAYLSQIVTLLVGCVLLACLL